MEPIIKVSVTDKAVEAIRNSIVSGAYVIGDKLPSELELSRQLQIGRSTVREALRILQAMGYVEIQHGKGAFVSQPHNININTAKAWFSTNNFKISDVMEVRLAIEKVSAQLCAANISPAGLQELADIQQQFMEAIQLGNVGKIVMLDELFHQTIAQFTGNELFSALCSQIAEALKSYRVHAFSVPEFRVNAIEPHQKIIDALKRHDAQLAGDEMAKHIQTSLAEMASSQL